MRSSWKTLGAISAIVLATALCAGAPPDVVPGDILADEINLAADGATLSIAAGTYTLDAPVYIKNTLTLSGFIDTVNTLPTGVVITQGAPPADDCFGNAVTNGGFELGGAPWTPSAIINNNSVEAYNGTQYALFTRPAVTGSVDVTLEQTGIVVPPGATELTFRFKAPTSGTIADSFKYTIDYSGTVPAVAAGTITGDTASSSYTPQALPIDPAKFGGKTVTLTFTATLADSPTPASFAIDNVCLAAPPALFTVDGGSLTMNNLEVKGESTYPAIKVNKGSLAMFRCMVDGAAAGVQFSGGATGGTFASCIFHGNGVDIDNQSGVVNILQCTLCSGTPIKANGIKTNLAASLLRSGGVSGTGGGNSHGNWISGNDISKLTQDTAILNIDSTLVTLNFLDTPFIGKLDVAPIIQSGASYNKLTSPPSSFIAVPRYSPDFKGQGRDGGNLGIGADEQSTTATVQDWNCTLTPDVTGPNSAPVDIAITVVGDGVFPTAAGSVQLRLAPEMPVLGTPGDINTGGLYILWPVYVDTPKTAHAKVSFSEPFQNGLCMDGVMHIGLDLGGGGGLVMPINDPPTFLVDTVAPEFDLYVNPPTVSITSPVVPVTEGLAGWPPLGGGIPKSGGSLLNTDVHWFIRKVIDPPLNQLNLRVYGHFVERRPVDVSGFEYAVTTSGFDPATAPAMTGSTPFAPTVTASPASGYLDVGWDFSGIADYGHWTFTPDARDRANNTVVVRTVAGGTAFTPLGHSLNAWWMPVPTAMFDASSTAPNQQTPNPQFSWKLTPSTGLTLQEEAPCFPIAGFQIWAVDPATQAYASLTGGWTWVDGAINKNTLVPTVGKSLLDILNDNRNNVSQSKQLFIAIRGGDEAGNVQPFNASLLGTSGSFEAGLAANGVDYRMWTNGASQGNVAVDTDLNVQLSHRVRATTGSDPVLRSFGSMARVPLPSLPEAKAGAYVNAQVSMGARYPELMNSTTTSVLVQVEWKLYEEGALVAQGRVKPQAYNQPYVFPLPQMLLGGAGDFNIGNATLTVDPAPDSRAFLRIGPDGLKNRMGDEASLTSPGRQRELRYMLVAQTVATIGSPTTTSQIIVDPTPATVEFSIYVREMLDKVREEQPVRIYERGQQNQ